MISVVCDNTFENDIIKSSKLILVDFWAPWCQPCKRLNITLKEISIIYNDKLKIVKMNIEENPETCRRYNIKSIPALLLYKDGNIIDTKIGGDISVSGISSFLNDNLNKI